MKRLLAVLLVLIPLGFVLFTINSEATLYRWKDKTGQIHITDYPPPPEEISPEPERPEGPPVEEKTLRSQKPVPQESRSVAKETPKPQPPTKQKPAVTPPQQGILKLPVPEKGPSKKAISPQKKTPRRPERSIRETLPRRSVSPTQKNGLSPTQLMALLSLGGLFYMVLIVALSLIFYFYTSLVLHMIGKKRGVSYAWTVWIPIVGSITSIFVILASAGRPLWWVAFFALPIAVSFATPYIPVLGIIGLILTIGVLILVVVLWMDITKKLGLNRWLGLLIIVPLINLIFMGYLAFKEEPEIEINRKKMILTAVGVYILLVVAFAIGIQYLFMPYLQSVQRALIQRQFQQRRVPIPKTPSITPQGITKLPEKSPPPQPMNPAAYDAALQRRAPQFKEGSSTYAGPVAIKMERFQDGSAPKITLKVRPPLLPNIYYAVVDVEIQKVLSINGANLYDSRNIFEISKTLHRVHLSPDHGYVEGQRDIYLLKGAKENMIKEIDGSVVLHLPLNLRAVELPVKKESSVTSQGTVVRVEEAGPKKVVLTLRGNAEVVRTIGLTASGTEISPSLTTAQKTEQGKSVNIAFPERPQMVKILLRTGEYLRSYPFSLRVR